MTIQRDNDLILRVVDESEGPFEQPFSIDDSLRVEQLGDAAGYLPEDSSPNSFSSWSNNSSSNRSLSMIDIFEPSVAELEQQIREITQLAAQHPRRGARRNRDIPTINELNGFGNDSFGINTSRMAGEQTARPRQWRRRERPVGGHSSDPDHGSFNFNQSSSSSCSGLFAASPQFNSSSSLSGGFAHDSLGLIRKHDTSFSGRVAAVNVNESESFSIAGQSQSTSTSSEAEGSDYRTYSVEMKS
jgi:hypothetical protein